MLTLFHHPMFATCRFVRLAFGEFNEELALIEEKPWTRRKEFLALNAAGTLPVLLAEGDVPIIGAHVIAEYLDETRGVLKRDRRLLAISNSTPRRWRRKGRARTSLSAGGQRAPRVHGPDHTRGRLPAGRVLATTGFSGEPDWEQHFAGRKPNADGWSTRSFRSTRRAGRLQGCLPASPQKQPT